MRTRNRARHFSTAACEKLFLRRDKPNKQQEGGITSFLAWCPLLSILYSALFWR